MAELGYSSSDEDVGWPAMPDTFDAAAARAEDELHNQQAAALQAFVRELILSRPGPGTEDERLDAAGFLTGWCDWPDEAHEVWEDRDGYATIVDGAALYTPWVQPAGESRAARRRRRRSDVRRM